MSTEAAGTSGRASKGTGGKRRSPAAKKSGQPRSSEGGTTASPEPTNHEHGPLRQRDEGKGARQVGFLLQQVQLFVEKGSATRMECEAHIEALEMAMKEALKLDMLEVIWERYLELRNAVKALAKTEEPTVSAGPVIGWPKEDLPVFGGTFAEWPAFEDAFRLEVADRPGYSEAIKLRKLKRCLTGEALNLVDKFGLHEEGAYESAWNLLKDHYSNSFEAFSECVRDIFRREPIARGDGVAARKLIGRVESLVEKGRKMVPAGDGIAAAAAVHLVEQMDASTREQFRASREDDSIPALEEVAKFFLRKVKTWEEGSVNNGARIKLEPKSYNADRTGLGSQGLKCYRCAGPHRLATCPTFARLGREEKNSWVRARGLCERCFGRHATAGCPRPIKRE